MFFYYDICLQYGDSLPKKDGPSFPLLLLPILYKMIIILPGCELHSSPLTWLPLLLFVGLHHFDSMNTLCDQICLGVMSSRVQNMQLCLKLACLCLPEDPVPTPPLSQEATGTQAPLAGVALRGPLSGDMVASCQRCTHTSSLVKLHTVTASPQQKQEGSPEITTRIEHSITHHACKMLNVFIRLVRGNLHGCECALSCVALVFWGWLSPKPRARIGMSQKRKCIHFYFYTLPKGMLM